MEKLFTGIHSAIFSVYGEDMNVKRDAVGALVEYQLKGGVSGFYVCGNTGECTVLPAKTRKQMLETVVDANAGRGKIMAHIGAGHFDESMELLAHANEQKIDAVASLPPSLSSYYGQQETLAYYRALAKESRYPVYAYITPVTLQHSDLYSFASALSEIDNVAGLKITIPDYFRFSLVNQIGGGRLNNLNGPDEMMLCGLSMGADGAIGTTYNMLPKVASGIYNSFVHGDMQGALAYQNKLNSFIKAVFEIVRGRGIAFWKACMTVLGFDMGYSVFPSLPISDADLQEIRAKMEEIGYFDMV